MTYLPYISVHKENYFDVWEVEKVENKWNDMLGWGFMFVVDGRLDSKLK